METDYNIKICFFSEYSLVYVKCDDNLELFKEVLNCMQKLVFIFNLEVDPTFLTKKSNILDDYLKEIENRNEFRLWWEKIIYEFKPEPDICLDEDKIKKIAKLFKMIWKITRRVLLKSLNCKTTDLLLMILDKKVKANIIE